MQCPDCFTELDATDGEAIDGPGWLAYECSVCGARWQAPMQTCAWFDDTERDEVR